MRLSVTSRCGGASLPFCISPLLPPLPPLSSVLCFLLPLPVSSLLLCFPQSSHTLCCANSFVPALGEPQQPSPKKRVCVVVCITLRCTRARHCCMLTITRVWSGRAQIVGACVPRVHSCMCANEHGKCWVVLLVVLPCRQAAHLSGTELLRIESAHIRE